MMAHLSRKALLIIVCVFLSLWTAAGGVRAAGRPSVEHLVGFFETVVFGAEIDQRMKSTVVARWTQPLRIALKGNVTQAHQDIIRRHLARITQLTGITIEPVSAPDKPENIAIVFVPAARMSNIKINNVSPDTIAQLAGPRSCYFLSFKSPPDQIIGSVIVVNVERDMKAIDHCLLEELVQSMGLPNDTDMLRPSIFSDHDHLVTLSRSDEILLRTLYDPRMTEGLGIAEALNVARRIITDLNSSLPPP